MTARPNAWNFNEAEYRDRVMGCWLGKNIGGTLGAPVEGSPELHDVTGYLQDLRGNPAANDDLDLQLIWLIAVEEQGLYHLSPRLLGEYWMEYIIAPWNEYAVCRLNIANGLYPPLSGACNNNRWKWSNGAWIRSEIWACLCPGQPDEALRFAYMDSCCDHCGEGIYAELFTTALEASAFVIHDLNDLLSIALSKIPAECRVAQNVRLVQKCHADGKSWKETREAIVAANADLGWFQAPGNLGFVTLALLYGQGDFARTVCLAVNCGDDTDCTAATVGSILGIMNGAKALPKAWTDPIGMGIQNIAIDILSGNVPQDLYQLTERVACQAHRAFSDNPLLIPISDKPTQLPPASTLKDAHLAQRIWALSPYDLQFDLSFARLTVHYDDGPQTRAGQPKNVRVTLHHPRKSDLQASCRWFLPEGWTIHPGPEAILYAIKNQCSEPGQPFTLTPPPALPAFTYIPLQLIPYGRHNPVVIEVPFQLDGALSYHDHLQFDLRHSHNRCLAMRGNFNANPEQSLES